MREGWRPGNRLPPQVLRRRHTVALIAFTSTVHFATELAERRQFGIVHAMPYGWKSAQIAEHRFQVLVGQTDYTPSFRSLVRISEGTELTCVGWDGDRLLLDPS